MRLIILIFKYLRSEDVWLFKDCHLKGMIMFLFLTRELKDAWTDFLGIFKDYVYLSSLNKHDFFSVFRFSDGHLVRESPPK